MEHEMTKSYIRLLKISLLMSLLMPLVVITGSLFYKSNPGIPQFFSSLALWICLSAILHIMLIRLLNRKSSVYFGFASLYLLGLGLYGAAFGFYYLKKA
jgi:hypothetical protein